MVKPSVKRKIIGYLKKKYQTGIEKCCKVVNMSRASWYYKTKLDDTEVIEKLNEMVERYSNRGFENYYYRLRREGNKWAWSRVLRVYREMGLVRRPKRRKRLPEGLRKPLTQPEQLNEVWSMDFMSDSLEDGRTLRVLNIIDDHNRECLCTQGSISFPSSRVIRQLKILQREIGLPKYIRTDNGPEFISKEYRDWCKKNDVEPVYAEPGKPTQNGYVERFNRTFREDVLDAYMFSSISQYNLIAEHWADDYNNYHPHDSLGKSSPREFAPRRQAYSELAPNTLE